MPAAPALPASDVAMMFCGIQRKKLSFFGISFRFMFTNMMPQGYNDIRGNLQFAHFKITKVKENEKMHYWSMCYSHMANSLMTVTEPAVGGGFIVFYIISILFIILLVASMWKIFAKADRPGWAAIVPFYNSFTLFDISFGNGWIFLTSLVPCVNIVFMVILCFKLAKAFDKGVGFGFGLLLLPVIFIPILAFGDAEFVPEHER